MARTLYLRIAYDGTEFHGWQDQPGVRTVQTVLKASIQRVVRHPVNLIGSGRTDAGVHADGQVASFATECALPVDKLHHAIGSRLPEDLAVAEVREVHPDFHATRSAVAKLYRYRIHNVPGRPVQSRTQRSTYHFWHPLDVARMREAARHFIGTHDFTAMAATGTVRQTMVRAVLRCDVERHLDEVRIDVMGDGFLHKQVRNMVGTLINIGRGQWEADRIPQILASRDRAQGGPTAPALGLCLRWVRYPAELLTPPSDVHVPGDGLPAPPQTSAEGGP